MQIRVLGPADYTAMPWRNGRGTTLELAREDNADGTMLWRVSSADVVEAGEFSRFPGIDRILMLTQGEGFDLDFGTEGRVGPVQQLVPIRFSGDWTTRAENVRGRSRDLNVMVARGRVVATVGVHREPTQTTSLADRSLLLVLAGKFGVGIGPDEFIVGASHLLMSTGATGLSATVNGAGLLVQIDIELLAN